MNYVESIRKSSRTWLIGLALLIVAASLRWWQLGAIQEPIFDEVHYVPAAEVLVGIKPHPGMGLWSSHPLIGKAPAPNFEHPLLAKFLIGYGMRIFGDNAFGWRFFASITGCFSLVLMGWLLWRFFQKPGLAVFGLFLLGFDSMHILHSRLAMLDIFLFTATVGLLIATHALIPDPKRWGPRLAAALCLAAGFSIKWVFAFSVIGFSWCLLFLGRGSWKQRLQTWVTVGILALLLYHLWFLYYAAHGFSYSEWIAFHIAANSVTTGSLAHHPYGASAFSMLMNSRNIWYYFKQLPDHMTVGLVCLMNPLLLFTALPALLVIAWNYIRHRERADAFILGWFVCCYAPFHLVLLQRQGFLYYMLLVQPILLLAVCRLFALLQQRWPRTQWALVFAFPFYFTALFFMPVTLALPMPGDFYLWVVSFTGV